MYIIDESYFIKELRIPNTNEIDVSDSADPFITWIDKEARQCLQLALGYKLFKELDDNITDGVLDTDAPQKWLNLVNGKDYTKDSKEYNWKGLKFIEGTFKGSLLAYYVYCKWLEFQLSYMSGMGETRGEAVNSMVANSTHRYVALWNTFVEMYQSKSTQTATITLRNGIPFYDYFGELGSYVSLIEFLDHHEEDYPNADKREFKFLNTFGI